MEQFNDVSITPGKGAFPEFIDDRNYADDPDVRTRVRDEVLAKIPRMFADRQRLQNRWDRFYKVWDGTHDRMLYKGRSDLYWRIGRKIIETFVSHLKTRTFPAVDSFFIEPDMADPLAAATVQSVRKLLRHDVEQARVEQKMPLLLREGLITGTAVVKLPWDVKRARRYSRVAPEPDSEMRSNFAARTLPLFEGPAFIPLNTLDFHVYPLTTEDLDDARIVLEELTVDRTHLKTMEAQGRYLNATKVITEERRGGSMSTSASSKDLRNAKSSGDSTPDKNQFRLYEIWAKFDLYGDGSDVSCKIVAVDDEILEVRQNPYLDQRPPYRVWRPIQVRNQFYGQGVMESIEHLNIAANAIGNQMLDAVQMQTNHIVGVNQAMLAQDISTIRIAPSALWSALSNPAEVFSIIRPPDNSQAAMLVLQLLSGAMQDIAGAPPFLQGKGTSKNTTATEFSGIAAGADAALGSMVRDVEVSVLSPMLRDWWIREQQFRALETAEKIGPSLWLEPEDLLGDYSFRWMVTSQVPTPVSEILAQAEAASAAGTTIGPGAGVNAAPGGAALPSLSPQPNASVSGLGVNPQLGL